MQYDRFEQLPVWQASIELAGRIYALTARPPFRRQRSLRDQIERAAVSISIILPKGLSAAPTRSC